MHLCGACYLFRVFVFTVIDRDLSVFSNGSVKRERERESVCVCYRGLKLVNVNFFHQPEIQIHGQTVVSVVKS
jgi:hypothetical protein